MKDLQFDECNFNLNTFLKYSSEHNAIHNFINLKTNKKKIPTYLIYFSNFSL